VSAAIRLPLEIAGKSDAGVLREHNEDTIVTVPELGLLVLADGMGGHSRGDVASRIGASVIVDVIRRGLAENAAGPMHALVRRAVKLANGAIYLESKRRAERVYSGTEQPMASTVAVVLIRDGRATIAHVGDSRVYRLREHRIELLTHDHTLLQEQMDVGLLDAESAGSSHNRHLVTRGLGFQPKLKVVVQESDALPGDVYLLCSDGLNDMVDNADIELVLDSLGANLPLAASQLVMIANDNGGEDNVSVILARIAPPKPQTSAWRKLLSRLFGD